MVWPFLRAHSLPPALSVGAPPTSHFGIPLAPFSFSGCARYKHQAFLGGAQTLVFLWSPLPCHSHWLPRAPQPTLLRGGPGTVSAADLVLWCLPGSRKEEEDGLDLLPECAPKEPTMSLPQMPFKGHVVTTSALSRWLLNPENPRLSRRDMLPPMYGDVCRLHGSSQN